MMKIAVLVSGGGTNLQAILDAIDSGKITNTQVSVVISNNANAYALERAKKHGIPAQCVSPKRYESRELFNRALLETIQSYHVDLVVLAGCLVVIPEMMVKAYPNRIINIHPSLIPAFCGPGFYGLHVHEHAFKRGVKVAGATVHFVSPVVDGGPIILQEAMDVSKASTPEEMQQMVLTIEHRILPEAVRLFCNGQLKVENERVEIL